jgi:hypothetical protein
MSWGDRKRRGRGRDTCYRAIDTAQAHALYFPRFEAVGERVLALL